jgi:hypothetical protein
MEGLVLMTTSNTYRADSAPVHGGHHLVDGLMRCDACWGVCLPQWRCRCCLTTEIEALRAQVRAVREFCADSYVGPPTEYGRGFEYGYNDAISLVLRALDGEA